MVAYGSGGDCLFIGGTYCYSSENITYIGFDKICFKPRSSKSKIKLNQNGIPAPFPIIPKRELCNRPFDSTGMMVSIDFDGNYAPTATSSGAISAHVTRYQRQEVQIRIVGRVKNIAKVNGIRQCSEEETLAECRNYCRATIITVSSCIYF